MNSRGFLAVVLLVGCGGTDAPPITPGEVGVELNAPGTPPGAMVLTVSGGPVASIRPISGVESAISTDAGQTRILLVGALDGGEVAVLTIPDRSQAARYVVHVDQVADAATFALLDPAAWSARLVTRP
jgi:hypothetical protein